MTMTLLTTLEESAPLVRLLRAKGYVDGIVATREGAETLRDADVVMINWPYILSDEFINRQRVVLNVHNSLLPRYRGRHAFTWAILNGERELGYSLHVAVPEIDAGDVLSTVRFPLADHEDVVTAFRRGQEALLAWLPPTLAAWARGELQPVAQDPSLATYFRKRNDEDNWLPSFADTTCVRNLVRAVAPPYTAGAKCRTPRGNTLRIASASLAGAVPTNVSAGTVLVRQDDELTVACADSALRLVIANADALGELRAGDRLVDGRP